MAEAEAASAARERAAHLLAAEKAAIAVAAARAALEGEAEGAFGEIVEAVEAEEAAAALAGRVQIAAPFAAAEPAAAEGMERPPPPEALLGAPGPDSRARHHPAAP